jgi:hypothetical protein
MATGKSKQERQLRVVKSHDGLDLGDTVSVVGDPDPRTAALLAEGYFEWVGDAPAAAAAPDAGNE